MYITYIHQPCSHSWWFITSPPGFGICVMASTYASCTTWLVADAAVLGLRIGAVCIQHIMTSLQGPTPHCVLRVWRSIHSSSSVAIQCVITDITWAYIDSYACHTILHMCVSGTTHVNTTCVFYIHHMSKPSLTWLHMCNIHFMYECHICTNMWVRHILPRNSRHG
jgi:hypothetical protein